MDYKTPEEVFTSEIPNVEHLRIFCCPIYVHFPKEERTKLEPSTKKGTFVSNSENSKYFRFYVPGKIFIETCRDVIFDMDVAFWKSKGSQLDSNDEIQMDQKNVESKSKELELMNQNPHEESDDPELVESIRSIVPKTRKRYACLNEH